MNRRTGSRAPQPLASVRTAGGPARGVRPAAAPQAGPAGPPAAGPPPDGGQSVEPPTSQQADGRHSRGLRSRPRGSGDPAAERERQ
ncbi:hypothetical protein Sfr7A_08895 [Streptomyces xinghaiensis]|uniref:Uncharacterized protein n=1 Tax=Streptomyces xinghaiensis TaxID=1038928 RepID=A0A3R7H8L0_9ACTN|nr:hypothetical protein Sfr7A_08895 [Streptomyces xinghaiensis]RKM91720.1 hypothetical protein SFRA_027415 [Streptomyces xinghaiensis]RNC73425.1 hypothetical protein DC095_015015 [Streptomyces xinghaiensis]